MSSSIEKLRSIIENEALPDLEISISLGGDSDIETLESMKNHYKTILNDIDEGIIDNEQAEVIINNLNDQLNYKYE